MDKSGNHVKNVKGKTKPVANWLLVLTTVLIGVTGIHDFIVGRTRQGILHLVLFLGSICLFWCGSNRVFHGYILIQDFAYNSFFIQIANWIWALCEIKIVLKMNSKQYRMLPKAKKVELNNRASVKHLKTLSIMSSIISVVLLVSLCVGLLSIFSCGGILWCEQGHGWILVIALWIGIWPYFLSIILTISTISLRLSLRDTGLIDKKLRRLSNITFLLFAASSLLFAVSLSPFVMASFSNIPISS